MGSRQARAQEVGSGLLRQLALEPVVDVETGYPPEMALVVGHDDQALDECRSTDEDVRVADRSTALPECSIDIRRSDHDLVGERENVAGLAKAIAGLLLSGRVLGLEAS